MSESVKIPNTHLHAALLLRDAFWINPDADLRYFFDVHLIDKAELLDYKRVLIDSLLYPSLWSYKPPKTRDVYDLYFWLELSACNGTVNKGFIPVPGGYNFFIKESPIKLEQYEIVHDIRFCVFTNSFVAIYRSREHGSGVVSVPWREGSPIANYYQERVLDLVVRLNPYKLPVLLRRQIACSESCANPFTHHCDDIV